MIDTLKKPSVSCIIPTYNRCPHKNRVELNPPWWAAMTLANQENVGEIIVVDDASTDFTRETVEAIRTQTEVPIRYFKNDNTSGCGKSRNRGVDAAKHDRIWVMDDDCVMASPDVLPKLDHAFNLLEQEGVKIGALTLPVGGGPNGPLESRIAPLSEIGKVDEEQGILHGCYTKFPREYVDNPDDFYLDREQEIFKPVSMDLMGAVFLANRKVFQDAGGFPTPPWKNACGEDFELMFKMRKQGNGIYYLPSNDISFRVVHFKYGDSNYDRDLNFKLSVNGIPIQGMLQECAIERSNTGCRVDEDEAHYSWVISNMHLMFKYFGDKAGLNNLRSKYSAIAEDTRKQDTFRRAVRDGLGMLVAEESIFPQSIELVEQEFLNL